MSENPLISIIKPPHKTNYGCLFSEDIEKV